MKALFVKLGIILMISTLASGLFFYKPAAAITFAPSNIMDDSVFDDTSTMSAAQIDSWLNSNFPSSCISSSHGFTANDPTGYTPSGGYTYGSNVSAGRVIYDAAVTYGLNPQVLLATLQKEQSLVSGDAGCSTLRYAAAVGYGCPDSGTTHNYPGEGALATPLYFINNVPVTSVSGTCVNSASKVGFSEQVIRGAWLLKFGEQRSKGNTAWNVQGNNTPQPGDHWDNSDDPLTCYAGPMTQGSFKRCSSDSSPVFYDGYVTIDGTSTHMDTGATAAFYWYTPHFNGNSNFDNIFSAWFGNIYGTSIGTAAYRMYNPSLRLHFYTARQSDRFHAKQYGFNDDGTAFNVSPTQEAGMIPIYRMYQGGINDYWFQPDGGNRWWALVKGGYRDEGVAFYAYPANATGSPAACSQGTPVYQLWSDGVTEHFYSKNSGDRWWGIIYGGYLDDKSSVYYNPNSGSAAFCVPTS